MGVGGVFHQGRPDARFRRPLPPTPRVPLPPASSPAAGPGPLYAPLIPETRVPLWLREILFPILNLFQTIGGSSSNLFSRQMIRNIRKTGRDCGPSAETLGLDFRFSLCRAGPASGPYRQRCRRRAQLSSRSRMFSIPQSLCPVLPHAFIPSNFFFVMSTPSLWPLAVTDLLILVFIALPFNNIR